MISADQRSISRPLFFAIAIFLVIGLLAGIAAVVLQPTLITGRYYEITFTSIEVGPHGELAIRYDDCLTYDTEKLFEGPTHTFNDLQLVETWDERKPEFLRWPKRYLGMSLSAYARSAEERDNGVKNLEMYRARVLVKEGTYRIRAGETLPLFRFKGADGRMIESRIVVRPRS